MSLAGTIYIPYIYIYIYMCIDVRTYINIPLLTYIYIRVYICIWFWISVNRNSISWHRELQECQNDHPLIANWARKIQQKHLGSIQSLISAHSAGLVYFNTCDTLPGWKAVSAASLLPTSVATSHSDREEAVRTTNGFGQHVQFC